MMLLRNRARVSVAITLAVVVVILALAGHYVVGKHLWAIDRLAELEPRYARLLGLREAGAQLEQSLKDARTAVSRLGFPADRDAAQVGNELQQLARRALQGAGLTLASSQVLPARVDKGVDRISVVLQAEGPLARLQLALAALQGETPVISVDGLTLQSIGRFSEDGSPIVSCRVVVAVLRLQS